MSDWFARFMLALPAVLVGAAPVMAQMDAPAVAGNFWSLVVLNAVVALLGLGWLLLMSRRRS